MEEMTMPNEQTKEIRTALEALLAEATVALGYIQADGGPIMRLHEAIVEAKAALAKARNE